MGWGEVGDEAGRFEGWREWNGRDDVGRRK
jgi:hypothetical protein